MTSAMRSALLAGLLWAAPAAAQDPVRVLDFGPLPDTVLAPEGIPDSVLARAVATFNAPTTVRIYGDAVLRADIGGTLGVHRGTVRIGGTVRGDVVILNGDLLLEAAGRILGRVTVLGGRFLLDPGARHDGPLTTFRSRAPVDQLGSGELVVSAPRRTLAGIASALTVQLGEVEVRPRVFADAYNRVEGLPLRLGVGAAWPASPRVHVVAEADVTLRTARDPAGTRGPTGWATRLAITRGGDTPFTLGFEASDAIGPTAERPFSSNELSVSALFLKRDWRDWYGMRRIGVFGEWQPRPTLTVRARVAGQRERSVTAVDAFSLLRADEDWRPNPLIDDGTYRVIEVGGRVDTRDPDGRISGWFGEVGVRRVGSAALTPVLLPTQVRDPLPNTDYASWELHFDVRRAMRLHPRYALHLRAAGSGWVGGDPLTVQHRLAMGGVDPLAGYGFREITCDPRRRPDPAGPALCDRQMVLQAELRRTIPARLGTRIGPYGLGIEQADLILFGDLGSAWLAGDGPGQVPAGRLQSLDEWRADIGVGIDAGLIGIYLAKALTDDYAPRLSLRLSRRF